MTKKKKPNIINKTMSYFLIFFSLLLIYFSFKYDLFDSIINNSINKDNGLPTLYAKNESYKKNELISKIAIKNGCGKKRLGLIYKRYLLDIGYDVTETTNATHPNGEFHFGHSSTKILFHKKNKDSAIYLSNELGINKNQIFEDPKETNFHDLTLILGQNYINLKSYKTANSYNPFNNDKK